VVSKEASAGNSRKLSSIAEPGKQMHMFERKRGAGERAFLGQNESWVERK